VCIETLCVWRLESLCLLCVSRVNTFPNTIVREEKQIETCTSIDHASYWCQDVAIDRIDTSPRDSYYFYLKIMYLAFEKNITWVSLCLLIIHIWNEVYESVFHFKTVNPAFSFINAFPSRTLSIIARPSFSVDSGARRIRSEISSSRNHLLPGGFLPSADNRRS